MTVSPRLWPPLRVPPPSPRRGPAWEPVGVVAAEPVVAPTVSECLRFTCHLAEGPWSLRYGAVGKCVLWTGATMKDGTTGRFRPTTRHHGLAAHRWAFEEANGPVPPGWYVVSVCGTSKCVEPRHHRALSRADARPFFTQRRRPHAKLNRTKARLIRTIAANGVTQTELARRFGVSQAQISAVVRGKAWVHFKPQ